MSNYPFSYKISWPARFVKPSLRGAGAGYLPDQVRFLPQHGQSVRLAFVGDISAVANRRPPVFDSELVALLGAADLVVGNCESPVVASPSARLGTRLGTHHAMTREFLQGALAAAAIAPARLVLSLANNHVLDQGIAGFEATCAALDELGIATIGTTTSVTKRAIGPVTLGLCAFTQWRNAPASAFAGRVAMADEFVAAAGNDLADGTDLVCAVPHWDWEFRHFPRPDTRDRARRLAELGVGLVVGHHAHVVQPIGRVGDTLVAYGLGDFLGTALARQPWPGRIGAILIVDVSADAATRGQIASYRMAPFMRQRDGEREKMMPLDKVAGELGTKARARWQAVYGAASPGFTS
ncbi:poly-gamma-glutamate synthesis protein (capsule biosynthesis protein) [Aminobacter lissarensis]|uniref:Poly-gamma-glutamate synthesis protein (Capsule biosynthesis protein) n=1 Tax=Aminobacter carboxidus TaxID=376165 RepID=A0A8E1W9K8_9HYPH|nr:poly-gamma-glutamate synthesis protein (capsule biosynthesis protein) [Aminobacter lissarensis]